MKTRRTCLCAGLLALVASLGWSLVSAIPAGVGMSRSATHFLETLSVEQRAKALLEYGTPLRLGWHFIPKAERKGLQIKEMAATQREAAHQLLRSALSEVGYDKAVKIMALEHILHELESKRREGALRNPERYFFTVFGPPSETGRWGLSVEGHHLSLNFVVHGGKVISSTPTFFGANPSIVQDEIPGGLAKGTRVLAKEEQLAFDLVNSLTEEQRRTAVLADKAPREIRAPGEPQPPRDAPAGLAASSMSQEQRSALNKLIGAYLENMPEEVRETRVQAIDTAGRDNVSFAWAGALRPGIGHYYRVQGSSFLIEFVNTQPDSAGNPANHIHCVWRDMTGDFANPLGQGSPATTK